MYWIDPFRLAEIHREIYAAILRSWVPHGRREQFSRQCGITREYFSCLCATDSPLGGSIPGHKRIPSLQLAQKIAKALPAPAEIRYSLIENMELSHVNAAIAYYSINREIPRQLARERVSEIERPHQLATFGKDLSEVELSYRVVRDTAKSLISQIDPEKNPDSFAQACLYYHDAQCVLNRPDEALRYAKIAQQVLEDLDQLEPGYSQEQRDNFVMNSIRGEAVAYHNLGLDRSAPDILLLRACSTNAYRKAKDFWDPIVSRDLINSLIRVPRFGFREVGRIIRRIETICERRDDVFTLLLVHESWLRTLLVHESWRQARQVMNEELGYLHDLPHVGALHRALLFKSGAQLAWNTRDLDAWREYVTSAVSLMIQAGLKHQLSTLQQAYGLALDPILAGLK